LRSAPSPSPQDVRLHPRPNSGFSISRNSWATLKRLPFDRSFWDPKFDPAGYTEIMVAPVNMDYVMAQSLWEKIERRQPQPAHQGGHPEGSAFTRNSPSWKAAQTDPKKHFQVVQTPGPKTLILETAVVQIVPSKAELNAVGIVFWEATAVELAGMTAAQVGGCRKGSGGH